MPYFQHDNTKNREHVMDNVLSFGTFQPLKSDQPLIPVSFCQVLLGCQFLSPPLLCVLRALGLQVHSLSAHYRWAQERELTSHPPLGSLKPSAVPSPSTLLPLLPPSASYGCSHHADHTNQALIYSIYTILLSPLWLQGI